MQDNQIVQVDFDKIDNSKNKDFKVRFSLETIGSNTIISIYEKKRPEPLEEDLLRRLGLLIRGNTLACRLLYSSQ